jgi:hemoglobin
VAHVESSAIAATEADLAHRRWFAASESHLRPFRDCPCFDRIGGQATVDRLVDYLYDGIDTDEELRPLFGRDLSRERQNLKRFFAEWLGGPACYSESAWAGLHKRHEDLPITADRADRWLGHLRHALSEAVAGEDDRVIILEQARAVALALVNHEKEATMPSGPQSVGRSRHRSELIASCGIGARTLAQATTFARRGRVDELAALVAAVPDALARPVFAAIMLQNACLGGRDAVIEWLLDRGVDVNRPCPLPVGLIGAAFEGVFYVTPLCAARMTNRSDLAASLLRRGARDDIFTAAFLGDVAYLRQLLTDRPALAQVPDPAADALTITPIHHAVAGGGMPALGILLEHTTEPVLSGGRALRATAQRGNREMIDRLLDSGADAMAVGAGRWVLDAEIAPRLAGAGASAGVGIDGQPSGDWVRISCTGNQGRKDDPAFVASLLRYGARVDQFYNGASPLHYVAKAGFVQTIRVLLDSGADRNALDDRGRTPADWLDHAAKSVNREATRRVLEARLSGRERQIGPSSTSALI